MSAQRAAADWVVGRGRRETRRELAQRIASAYGVVLILILITFVVMMTLPPEGWGGRVTAVAVAGLAAIVAFTSSDVRLVVLPADVLDAGDGSSAAGGGVRAPSVVEAHER
jgi:hypothetical protein